MPESRPDEALVKLVKLTVETVETEETLETRQWSCDDL